MHGPHDFIAGQQADPPSGDVLRRRVEALAAELHALARPPATPTDYALVGVAARLLDLLRRSP